MKIIKSRKFVGSLLAVVALSTALSGCKFNTTVSKDKGTTEIVVDATDNFLDESTFALEEKEDIVEETKDDVKEAVQEETVEEEITDTEEQEEKIEKKEPRVTFNKVIVDEIDPELVGLVIPDIGEYNGSSIVDALRNVNAESSFKYRSKLAKYFKIENYKGTAKQNLYLIECLRKYHFEISQKANEETKIEIKENNNDYVEELEVTNDYVAPSFEEAKEEAKPAPSKPMHNHIYKLSGISYIDNDNGTHKEVKTYKCIENDSTKTEIKTESCTYGEWETDTTTQTKTRECEKCGHLDKEYLHDHDWVSSSDDDYEYETCSICNEQTKKAHSYGSWEYADTDNCKRTCSSCGKVITKGHNIVSNGIKSSSTIGSHIESYKCTNCGEINAFDKTVSCTNGTVEISSDHLYEDAYCTVCGDLSKHDAHSHSYGDWKYLDADSEYRECLCGTQDPTTRSHDYQAISATTEKCTGCGHEREIVVSCTHELEAVEGTITYVHGGKDGTCYTQTYKCTKAGCDYTETKEFGHSETSKKVFTKSLDSYCYSMDTVCSECNDTLEHGTEYGHDLKTEVVGAFNVTTCENIGCTAQKEELIPPTGFSMPRQAAFFVEDEEDEDLGKEEEKVTEEVIDEVIEELIKEYMEELAKDDEEELTLPGEPEEQEPEDEVTKTL